jgi:WXG100 family type VII secretion target
MSNILQLKYDELRIIVKGFKDNGEDITLLHAKTRDRVHGLYGQWMGDAADKFFEDMENKHLPSLARTAQALFAMQDVLLQVRKLVYETDLETVQYFRRDFYQFDSFSAGGIDVGLSGLSGRQVSAMPEPIPKPGGPVYKLDSNKGTVQMNNGDLGETPPAGNADVTGDYRSSDSGSG